VQNCDRSSRSWDRSSPKPGPGFDLDRKLPEIDRLRELTAAPDFWNDPGAASKVSRRLASLESDVDLHETLTQQHADLTTLYELASEAGDADTFAEVTAGAKGLRRKVDDLEIRTLLNGEYDESDAIVQIQAGAGGTESQDWAYMLLRMLTRFCERSGYTVELIEFQEGEEAGIKGASFIAKGRFAFGNLSCEHGVHRLVRISPFDAQKRRHTSFAGVDVVPKLPDEDYNIEVPDDDLRIDVYRSSGAGGQHVNTTDSAVRITHLPTGLVVTSQNERSQLQNKANAMGVLKAKLVDLMRRERKDKINELRGERRGIDFGSQIRNYVMAPYQMVKDTRTSVETSDVNGVLDGDLNAFVKAQLEHRRSEAVV
jgi:peptide chain release factor 2